jgi:RNA polymerase sigma factor (sigma-70 family)
VARARRGDQDAWRSLFEAYNGLLLATARKYGLTPSACDDVAQTTWMRLFQNVSRLRDDAALPSWLVTTSTREALNALRHDRREVPCDDAVFDAKHDTDAGEADELVHGIMLDQLVSRVQSALGTLPERDRRLIAALFHPSRFSYRQIGLLVGMPVGSIGPVRQRILHRLQVRLADVDPRSGDDPLVTCQAPSRDLTPDDTVRAAFRNARTAAVSAC